MTYDRTIVLVLGTFLRAKLVKMTAISTNVGKEFKW